MKRETSRPGLRIEKRVHSHAREGFLRAGFARAAFLQAIIHLGRSLVLMEVLMSLPTGSGASELPDFDALWDYDHPDSTEAAFRALLPGAEESGNLDYRTQLLTQVARSEGLQKKFDDAHRTLDLVDSLLRSRPEDELPMPRIRSLLERGRTLNSSGKPKEAQPLFLAAWDLARKVKEDFFAVDAAHMVAIVESKEASVEWNLKAMDLAEASENPKAKKWLGALYNNLGWTFHDGGQHEKALELFRKGLEWRSERGQVKETRIAKWCVARALRALDRVPEALAMQEDLLREFEAAGERDGYVHEELGECLLLLDRAEEAKPQFASAYALLSQDRWLPESEPGRIERLRELGGVPKP